MQQNPKISTVLKSCLIAISLFLCTVHSACFAQDLNADPEIITSQLLLQSSLTKPNPRLTTPNNKTQSQLTRGIRHIFTGLDHWLIVLLIILAASSSVTVLKNVTAFTIGHTISLAFAASGQFPHTAWVIPVVEFIIAATILYGALLLILHQTKLFTFQIILILGVIHGFGLLFQMADVFNQTGGLTIYNLAVFNLGIEIGQIIIFLIAAPLFYLANKLKFENHFDCRRVIVLIAIAISLFWIIDRGATVLLVI